MSDTTDKLIDEILGPRKDPANCMHCVISPPRHECPPCRNRREQGDRLRDLFASSGDALDELGEWVREQGFNIGIDGDEGKRLLAESERRVAVIEAELNNVLRGASHALGEIDKLENEKEALHDLLSKREAKHATLIAEIENELGDFDCTNPELCRDNLRAIINKHNGGGK